MKYILPLLAGGLLLPNAAIAQDSPFAPRALAEGKVELTESSSISTSTTSIGTPPITGLSISATSTAGSVKGLSKKERAAWQLYHEATLSLATGSESLAQAKLELLRSSHPDTMAAARAQEILTAMGPKGID